MTQENENTNLIKEVLEPDLLEAAAHDPEVEKAVLESASRLGVLEEAKAGISKAREGLDPDLVTPSSESGNLQSSDARSHDAEKRSKFDFPLRPLEAVSDLMAVDIPEPVVYIGDGKTPLLSEGTIVLAAPPKLGKSWFCLNLAIAISTGADFLGFHTRKAHVQYYDLEQSSRIRQKRIRQALEKMGAEVPEGLYCREELQSIGHGFKEQIEYDLQNDPEIGVFVIDIFPKIEASRKNTESEYSWTYRNFSVVNDLARKYHVAIILVLHTRKSHDPDHPFDNILGSTANQGAASHMIVLTKNKFNSNQVHLYALGRETEGTIELDYTNQGGQLVLSETVKDQPEDLMEFMESEIRDAIVKLMGKTEKWSGRCSGLIDELARQEIGIDATPKQLGAFLSKNAGRFMKHDRISVSTKPNGTGGRTYTIENVNTDREIVATVDEWEDIKGLTPFETA